MKENYFPIIVLKTTVIHTVTYFMAGLLCFLLLDYNARYADSIIAVTLRPTDHPFVKAGPLFSTHYAIRSLPNHMAG